MKKQSEVCNLIAQNAFSRGSTVVRSKLIRSILIVRAIIKNQSRFKNYRIFN